MSTEREMTEAAALAMGLSWHVDLGDAEYDSCGGLLTHSGLFDPRNNCHDSFLLAARLRINVEHNHPCDSHAWVWASIEGESEEPLFQEDVPDESQRADRIRLAILRCAAAQAPKSVGAGGPESASETAGTRMNAGFRRGGGLMRMKPHIQRVHGLWRCWTPGISGGRTVGWGPTLRRAWIEWHVRSAGGRR